MTMVIHIRVEDRIARFAIALSLLLGVTVFGSLVFREFTLRSLGEPGYMVDPEVLISAVEYFPTSSGIRAKLARSYMDQRPPDFRAAEEQALQAVKWSPNSYQFRVLLGEVRFASGNLVGAEEALSDALRVAPNSHEAHWRMANLMLASGRVDKSIAHFRSALSFNPSLRPLALEMLWTAKEDSALLIQVAGDEIGSKLGLANFLVGKSRAVEAVRIMSNLDRESISNRPETEVLLNRLIAQGSEGTALQLWRSIKSPGVSDKNLVWNGDFEEPVSTELKQFDWQLNDTKYAKVQIDATQASSGSHSLLVELLGRDTTLLEQEVTQLLVIPPGGEHEFSFFFKTEGLISPTSGPITMVLSARNADGSRSTVAQSAPFPNGNNGWTEMKTDFKLHPQTTAPTAVTISLRRQPRYAYDEPSKGRLWIDAVKVGSSKGN